MTDKREALEHFRLKSLDLGQLTGVSIASHAIPDAFLLLHSGVGCKHKATTQLSTHDLARSVVDREAWTEVGDASLIAGSTDRLGPYARVWHERVKPALMFVISVTFLDLTGDDYVDEVRRLDADLPGRTVFVKAPGFAGDLWSGYASAVVEVIRGMDWSVTPDRADQVAFLGYFWDRYEGDQTANLSHLGSLLKGIGLTLGPVVLSGTPVAQLGEAPRARVLVDLPYVAGRTKAIKRITGRDHGAADLPVGLRGTSAFLRAVGRAAGAPEGKVTAFVSAQEASTRQRIAPFAAQMRGRRVALFADLPLLAGLIGLAEELGFTVEVAGIRGHTLGGRDKLEAMLARIGVGLPAGCEVLENPSVAAVRDVALELLREDRLDGVIGSATDLNAIAAIPAAEFPDDPGVFRIEVGFPCLEHHVVYPMPTLGYAGVLSFVQRLMAPPRFHDAGRARFG